MTTSRSIDLQRDADRRDHRARASARATASTSSTAIVFATGFDAMTGAADRHSTSVAAAASRCAEAGPTGRAPTSASAIAGFPNLFTITGPGSPSVLSNMMVSIEQHVDWIAGALDVHARARPADASRPTPDAEDGVGRPRQRGRPTSTLCPTANSWYMGANVPGKPRVFMPYIGGVGLYREICDGVAAKGYEGFELS
ncbi:MAG: hypothetical protein WKF58_08880 [Ilumatobacteraceae bacterium]